MSYFVYLLPLFRWMLDFNLAPIFLLASDQEQSNSATLLPRFSLALVVFLEVQSFQMSNQEICFPLVVRLKFQIAKYMS
jgi:F0F1-type ATP synthase membrane subunit a